MSDDEIRITSATGGSKGQKAARFELIPSVALRELAELFGKGSEKYPPDESGLENWRRSYSWSLSIGALNRHLNAFMSGEDYDDGPGGLGSKHIISVAWHALVLATFMDEHPEYDDRQQKLADKNRNTDDS